MTDERTARPFLTRRSLVYGAAAAAAVGTGAVYGITTRGGNSPVAGKCRDAGAAAEAAAPFARGEIAGFIAADTPIHVADLAFKDASGADVTLSDFAGRTVLFNLWATWCAPCRYEMPSLDRLQARLGGDAFQVLAVNIDTGSSDKPKKFLAEINADNLAFYRDGTMAVFNTLKSRGRALGMPTTLLVGPDGCEIGTLSGPAEWDSEDAVALIEAALEATGHGAAAGKA